MEGGGDGSEEKELQAKKYSLAWFSLQCQKENL